MSIIRTRAGTLPLWFTLSTALLGRQSQQGSVARYNHTWQSLLGLATLALRLEVPVLQPDQKIVLPQSIKKSSALYNVMCRIDSLFIFTDSILYLYYAMASLKGNIASRSPGFILLSIIVFIIFHITIITQIVQKGNRHNVRYTINHQTRTIALVTSMILVHLSRTYWWDKSDGTLFVIRFLQHLQYINM